MKQDSSKLYFFKPKNLKARENILFIPVFIQEHRKHDH